MMKTQDFSVSFLIDQTREQAFEIVRNVRGWWSGVYDEEIEGKAEKVHDEFIFRAAGGAHYSKQKLMELIPGQKIVWLVTDSKLDFLNDKSEWTGSELIFDFSTQGEKTKVVFTHRGLTPALECFDACSNGWNQYFTRNLKPLLAI